MTRRVALVLGGACCVNDDLQAARRLGQFAGIVCCNNVGIRLDEPIDAWVSLHGDNLPGWLDERLSLGLSRPRLVLGPTGGDYERFCPPLDATIKAQFKGQTENGSSGLFALRCALEHLKFDAAVLCGIPMDTRQHLYGGKPWSACGGFIEGWKQALPQIRDRARSMSGWTAEILGMPTKAWVAG